jgi:hypothetical protein
LGVAPSELPPAGFLVEFTGVDIPDHFSFPLAIVVGMFMAVPATLVAVLSPLARRRVRRFRCSSILRVISSLRWRMAMQNLEPARMRSPFQRKMKGIMHMRVARPPRSEQAPAMPRRVNMAAVARGRTVARREREQEAAALAEAANIS